MKVSRVMEILSKCSPDADVRIYFPNDNFSDSVEFIENHTQQKGGEQSVFLYGFSADEEHLKSIWRPEQINVIEKESDFMKTQGS